MSKIVLFTEFSIFKNMGTVHQKKPLWHKLDEEQAQVILGGTNKGELVDAVRERVSTGGGRCPNPEDYYPGC